MDVTTIQEILKAVLLIIVGALISGVGIFFFQKRVEARNQRESVKFVRNFQKRLDALEDIHGKMNSFSKQLSNHLHKNEHMSNAELFAEYEIISRCFEDNLIYFSTYEKAVLENIFVQLYLYVIWSMKEISYKPIEGGLDIINSTIKGMKMNFTFIDPAKPDFELFYAELEAAFFRLVKEVRTLYTAISKVG